MPKVQFETIDELRQKIGQEVAVGDWMPVTQEQINLFAEATGDYQWIHLDKERAAKESPYGTTIAHGFLTLSLIPRLMADNLQLPPAKMTVNYGLNRVRFAAPVPAGKQVRPRITLLGIDEVTGGLQFNWKIQIEVQGSEKPACIAETLSRQYL
ncbi:MaoC family dehydratase [Desulfatitalea alkaliphila]|uniref:MaoC family dehydratase n=1 Tax=Desulfatitalea alkaliphila TaxID=2929485 RepID=A0AA41R669_9BACT|nr:MaoC family dehydratase [Desulfatitalea alkaliphila]MCJ8503109.1 MaoC family dehydratase [Desulfatitalea alkaliphila]